MEKTPDGLLLLDKPVGLTSHTAVRKAARLLGADKAGHAGTLDPMASGLLLVGIGKATRLLEYLVGCSKTYRAVIRLGMTTDTLDQEGTVLSEKEVPDFPLEEVEKALALFRGKISQIPPVYSAIKSEGVPLYRRARRGEEVTPPAREVEISRLDLMEWKNPFLKIEVECSSGTYIRSLARDIGEALDTGGVLWELRRLRCGPFSVEDAFTFDDLAERYEESSGVILEPSKMVFGLPKVAVSEGDLPALGKGQSIAAREAPPSSPVALMGPDGRLVAIAAFEGQTLSPHKVFL
ncbi:tRNA pseudouridine(55) synthase TruB [bacterium]|nr:MAG: tRNA pseudouridine(55) synthase TruB [bacterium]